ncbi:carboxypeptidase-like regulatory domain-containing protein, partial [Streptomyces sp. T21Q-yed]
MGLSARIRTRDGWAVSHAVVTVTNMTGTQVLRAEADAEGAVRDAHPLAPGAYTVIVTAVGYAPAA